MIVTKLICLLIGYAFGLIQTAYIYGRLKGIDIREHGSGNSGTTNMLRTMGLKAGVITLLGDAFKCVFAVLLVWLLFRGQCEGDEFLLLRLYTAAGVILGHNYPFYLKFKGGKGIAATAGMIISMGPWHTLLGCIVFFGIFFTTHYVSLGSLMVYVGLLAGFVVLGVMKMINLTGPEMAEMYIILVLLAAMAFWRHRENIVRLFNGTERKTYLKKKPEIQE